MFDSIKEFFNGKKGYLTGIATFILGGLMAMGIEIPDFAWTMLTGFGIIAGRDALKKMEN